MDPNLRVDNMNLNLDLNVVDNDSSGEENALQIPTCYGMFPRAKYVSETNELTSR